MFYSTTIPDILAIQVNGQPESAYASMTVEKSLHAQKIGARVQSDDAQALSMLYEHYRRPIHSYIYRLLGNQEDADDLTQEVFVRACLSWGKLYERDNLSAWLYRIATNLCLDVLRRRKRISWWPLGRHYNTEDNSVEDGGVDIFTELVPQMGGIPEVAEREHIRLALAKLPQEYAIALVLSAAQGVPYQEIAQILGISPNAAATRISRAKRMFAEHYQQLSQDSVGMEGQ